MSLACHIHVITRQQSTLRDQITPHQPELDHTTPPHTILTNTTLTDSPNKKIDFPITFPYPLTPSPPAPSPSPSPSRAPKITNQSLKQKTLRYPSASSHSTQPTSTSPPTPHPKRKSAHHFPTLKATTPSSPISRNSTAHLTTTLTIHAKKKKTPSLLPPKKTRVNLKSKVQNEVKWLTCPKKKDVTVIPLEEGIRRKEGEERQKQDKRDEREGIKRIMR